MVDPLLDALARYLAAAGIGLVYDPSGAAMSADWSIFPGGLPAVPDRAVGLTRYAIVEALAGEPWTTVRVQARVRGTADPGDAGDVALTLWEQLVGLGPVELHGGLWVQLVISVQAGPISLGADDSGRHEYTVNVEIEYRNPTPHRP